MNDQSQFSEREVVTQALEELGISAEESMVLIKELEAQTNKVIMLELLSRLSENEYPELREQLAGKNTDAQAQVMRVYLGKRFTAEERREAAQEALQKIVPELQKQLGAKMASVELDERDQERLQGVVDRLSAWLSTANH